MTKQSRRKFSAESKARVALAAIRDQHTLAELSKQFEVSSVMISKWKSDFLSNASSVFSSTSSVDQAPDVEKLYAQIGQLKVENDFLKKSCKRLGI